MVVNSKGSYYFSFNTKKILFSDLLKKKKTRVVLFPYVRSCGRVMRTFIFGMKGKNSILALFNVLLWLSAAVVFASPGQPVSLVRSLAIVCD